MRQLRSGWVKPKRGSALGYALFVALLVGACSEPQHESDTGRWYSVDQVVSGGPIFAEHCAVCHGVRAQGAEEWFRRQPDGRWPPPPLNGTAHAWHHPLWQLRQQIREGSQPEHGNMPAFGDVLSPSEIDAVIAWFQSFWPEEIYAAWLVYDANVPTP